MRKLLASVLLGAALLTIVDARSSYMMINDKPVIDLNRKPPPVSFKAPQERRSALFPKRFLKFTVDSDTPQKINTYKTPEVSSENPVVRKFNFNRRDPIVSENAFRKISRSTKQNQLPENRYFNNINLNDNIQVKMENAPSVVKTYKPIEANPIEFSSSKYIDEGDISSVNSEINEDDNLNVATETTTEVEKPTKVEGHVSEEIENERNHPTVDVKEANNMENEGVDYSTQENYYSETLGVTAENHNQYPATEMVTTEGDNSEEIVTEAYDFVNESNKHFREVRSVNIIEEEHIVATTLPGPIITGRGALLISFPRFRNINS